MTKRRIALVSTALAALATGLAAPVRADVPPGFDLFETDPETTVFSLREEFALPPSFFSPGSDAFAGDVRFGGDPINRFNGLRVGAADTVVRRPETAQTGQGGDTVPIELVSLNLVSVQPLAVTYGGQARELWDVRMGLSPARPSVGEMQIRQNGAAGTYDARTVLAPVFDFERLCVVGTRRVRGRRRAVCRPEADPPVRRLDAAQLPESAQQRLVIRERGPWVGECALPAPPVPGLNDGFCAGLSPQRQAGLVVGQAPLFRRAVRAAPFGLEHFNCYGGFSETELPERTVTLRDQFAGSAGGSSGRRGCARRRARTARSRSSTARC